MEGNSGGGGGSGGADRGGGERGGNDVELVCKTLQVEHKLFYFDLKENPRGRYLKISEKTSATRSTIIVPSSGISWFLDLFNYYVNSDDHDLFSKELQLDSKVFYFDIGENRRGRFLKVRSYYYIHSTTYISICSNQFPHQITAVCLLLFSLLTLRFSHGIIYWPNFCSNLLFPIHDVKF